MMVGNAFDQLLRQAPEIHQAGAHLGVVCPANFLFRLHTIAATDGHAIANRRFGFRRQNLAHDQLADVMQQSGRERNRPACADINAVADGDLCRHCGR